LDKTGRFRHREDELKKALSEPELISLWNSYIRDYLRSQVIYDLHDHYDFHINRSPRIQTIIDKILNGKYKPESPIRYRSEKGNGIARQLVILFPEDAIVIEAIGQYLLKKIKKAEPTNRAYYSRNHRRPKGPENVDETFGYPWWILWPEFQEQILNFTNKYKTIVVTDVATYYDNIDFIQLRNFLSSIDKFSEIFLDFTFNLLESFVWRPDYLPYPGKGLPQINLDTPRLLAHAFLFEVDQYLSYKTNNNFVRWLDDIDFAVDNSYDAKLILRGLDEILLSRGLHLNSSKTKILDSKTAFEHFQLRENRYLTIFSKRIERLLNNKSNIRPEIKRLRKRFIEFNKSATSSKSKVIKRYITLFGKMDDNYIEMFATNMLENSPELRETIFRYFKTLGWSFNREKTILGYIDICIDDHSLFCALDVLLSWQNYPSIKYILRMRKLSMKLSNSEGLKFLASIWLAGKYCNSMQIKKIVTNNLHKWRNDDWLGRQVCSIIPRMCISTKQTVNNVTIAYGLSSSRAVIDNFAKITISDQYFSIAIQPYILATKKDGTYIFPKFLISLGVLKGNLSNNKKEDIKNRLLNIVNDPIYRLHFHRT